jgi:hypothetical protein
MTTPIPKTLYVHDDLSDDVSAHHGAHSDAARAVAALLELVARDVSRVRILTLEEQLAAVVLGAHAPFALAVGIGRAGERVARQIDARTGWFPRIDRVELAREEHGDGYALSTLGRPPLATQLAGVGGAASIAVVDDTIFSGLTMLAVLRALPATALARTHAFCLRTVGESLADFWWRSSTPCRGCCSRSPASSSTATARATCFWAASCFSLQELS